MGAGSSASAKDKEKSKLSNKEKKNSPSTENNTSVGDKGTSGMNSKSAAPVSRILANEKVAKESSVLAANESSVSAANESSVSAANESSVSAANESSVSATNESSVSAANADANTMRQSNSTALTSEVKEKPSTSNKQDACDPPEADDQALADAGWEEYDDGEGNIYYWNRNTEESTWDRPVLKVAEAEAEGALNSEPSVQAIASANTDAKDKKHVIYSWNSIVPTAEVQKTEFSEVLDMLSQHEIVGASAESENEAARMVYGDDFDDEEFSPDAAAATCRFLLRLLSHHNETFKQAGRMILSQQYFTTNLEYFKAWDVLHAGTGSLLADLGVQLRDIYVRDQLEEHLGSFQPQMTPEHTGRQDFALPHPPGCDWTQQDHEEIYIHFLRLISYAIDERFHRAVVECVAPFNCDQTFVHKGIKSIKDFPRMLNKMLAAEDHRYETKPRPAKNIDINRTLVPTADWQGMLGTMEALQKRFGNFAKFKNQMSLSEADAAVRYHLRLMMVSVQFKTGITFAELCKDPEAQKRWSEYRQLPPASTVPGGRWCRQVETAFEWLHSSELADQKVTMVCEVQCVLREYRDVRLKMHEIYKVHRADDGNSLYNDFKKIRVAGKRKEQWVKDGASPELLCCRDNTTEELRMLTEAHGGLNDPGECLEVAARHGSADAFEEVLEAESEWVAEAIIDDPEATVFLLQEIIESPDNFKTQARIVESLLKAKAYVDGSKPDGTTGLYMAAKKGHLDLVHVLLQAKASVETTDTNGVTSMFQAAQEGHEDVVRVIVEAKANVNDALTTDETPALLMMSQLGHLNVLRVLLGAKADIDAYDHNGMTSLFMAVQKGYVDVVRVLAEFKANINLTKADGTSSLFMAAQKGYTDVVRVLLESKARVDKEAMYVTQDEEIIGLLKKFKSSSITQQTSKCEYL